jgi:hypothetical protein
MFSLPYLPAKRQKPVIDSWYANTEEAYDAAADLLTEADAYEFPEEIRSYAATALEQTGAVLK